MFVRTRLLAANPDVFEDFGGGRVRIQGEGDVFIGYPDDDPRAPFLQDGVGQKQRLSDAIGAAWVEEREG